MALRGGRYDLKEILGRGGVGTVYRAYQNDLRREVAIKVISAGGASPEALARFAYEARAAAVLRSPHVVQVFDFNQDDPEEPYIVMELLSGETLQAVLARETRLTEARTVAIVSQLLTVLDEVHRNSIVHRDVKPSNIQLVRDPHMGELLKLLDFGVAKLAQASRAITRDGFIIGTASYMPPEQIFTAEVDGRSDLYAVGAVMFECLVGGRLSKATDVLSVLRDAQTRPEFLPLPELHVVSPRMYPLIQKALAKNPNNRFGSAKEMRDALLQSGLAPANYAGVSHSVPAPAPAISMAPSADRTLPLNTTESQPGPASPRTRRTGLVIGLVALGVGGLAAAGGGAWHMLSARPADTRADAAIAPGTRVPEAPVAAGRSDSVPKASPSAPNAGVRVDPRAGKKELSDAGPKSSDASAPRVNDASAPNVPVVAQGRIPGAKCDIEGRDYPELGMWCTNALVYACNKSIPRTYCPGQEGCKNFGNDRKNCGSCGNACQGSDACSDGKCKSCESDFRFSICNGACTSIATSKDCGGCGVRCDLPKLCRLKGSAYACQ
jgi:eukaryotic-like serine/threonine-protein kinase